jgi:hypothetical protein
MKTGIIFNFSKKKLAKGRCNKAAFMNGNNEITEIINGVKILTRT